MVGSLSGPNTNRPSRSSTAASGQPSPPNTSALLVLQREPEGLLRAAAEVGDGDRVADLEAAQDHDELVDAVHGSAVELEDDVARLQSRLLGRATGQDRRQL